MATSNFRSMDNFGLFVKVFEPMSIKEFEKELFPDSFEFEDYANATEPKLKENILKSTYENIMQLDEEIFYNDIFDGNDGFLSMMDDFNDKILFHKLTLKSGYYDGVQIYIEETENPDDMDNSDTQYYFEMCRSKAIRKYESEIRKINKWLKTIAALQYGWECLQVCARFSNGETFYKRVAV